MKRIIYLLTLIFSLSMLIACDGKDEAEELIEMGTGDTDDDGGEEEQEQEMTRSYFALSQGNNWKYDVAVDAMEPTRDTLTVVAPVTQDGQVFSDLEATETSTGFMTGLFAGGLLLERNAQLTYTGSLTVDFDPENPITVEIPSSVLYDEAIASGTQLSINEQTIMQDFNGFPITVDIVATTRQLDVVENYTAGDFTFDRAIQSELVINATLSTLIAGIPVTLLTPQDVLVVTNTYAQDTGLVSSTVNFQYEFVDLSPFGIELPFPSTAATVTQQTIVAFLVN